MQGIVGVAQGRVKQSFDHKEQQAISRLNERGFFCRDVRDIILMAIVLHISISGSATQMSEVHSTQKVNYRDLRSAYHTIYYSQ
jgi:hypothetical protein